MSRFRATDEQLDREIAALERIARVRLRRTIEEMRELERDLGEMKRERARRKAEAMTGGTATDASVDPESAGA